MKVENGVFFEEMRWMLNQGLDARFTVSGNSMWPTLAHGRDQVVISPVAGKLKRGDVVLFCPMEGKYLLHRIYRLRPRRIYTAGDGNCYRDGDFPQACVLGKVTKIVRKEKEFSCSGLWYRLRSRVWMGLYPVRPVLLKLLKKLASRRKKK